MPYQPIPSHFKPHEGWKAELIWWFRYPSE